MQTQSPRAGDSSATVAGMPLYSALFFFSGFPALLYQIVWQRALFTIYGVNTESVTVIVTVFMLGLGFGSLAGGWFSKRPAIPLLGVFGTIELGISFFGLISLKVFHARTKRQAMLPGLPEAAESVRPTTSLFPPRAGLLLSASIGFIALCYEIVWYRLYSLASGRSAACFAMMLGWYLAGVAYGS